MIRYGYKAKPLPLKRDQIFQKGSAEHSVDPPEYSPQCGSNNNSDMIARVVTPMP